jgi:hypothetical protein
MHKKRRARDYYSLRASRFRKVLELAMADLYRYDRKQMRVIFAACEGLQYNVLGYKAKLEQAIKYIKRAERAIKALENDDEN